MSQSTASTERRMFCLQLTFSAFAGKSIRAEELVEYAAKLEEYLEKGKSSGLKVAGT